MGRGGGGGLGWWVGGRRMGKGGMGILKSVRRDKPHVLSLRIE